MLTGWNKVIQPCSHTGKDWHKAKFTTVVSMLCCLSKEENSFYRRGKSGPWKGFDRIEQTAFKHVNEFSAGNVDPFWQSPNFIMVLGWWFTEEGIFMLTRNVDLGWKYHGMECDPMRLSPGSFILREECGASVSAEQLMTRDRMQRWDPCGRTWGVVSPGVFICPCP